MREEGKNYSSLATFQCRSGTPFRLLDVKPFLLPVVENEFYIFYFLKKCRVFFFKINVKNTNQIVFFKKYVFKKK